MATKKEVDINIVQLKRGVVDVRIIGVSPLILHCMSQKVIRELVLPRPGKKNAAERASALKHDVLEEFRDSAQRSESPDGPLLCIPATAFKGAMRSAALDMPGASKSQIGRLTYVEGEEVQLYGLPSMHMSVVRSADINHTPDVRTRCILRHWAAQIRIVFAVPILTETSVLNLLAMAGETCGVGDFRPGKGAGSYGRFELADGSDPRFEQIARDGGREQQSAIMEADEPPCYDQKTADLYQWFITSVAARGRESITKIRSA